jgi:hypothetical protein
VTAVDGHPIGAGTVSDLCDGLIEELDAVALEREVLRRLAAEILNPARWGSWADGLDFRTASVTVTQLEVWRDRAGLDAVLQSGRDIPARSVLRQ